jgi:glutathione peroxidase
MGSVYEFHIKNVKGETVSFSDYRGKVLLIVNVASKCGLTPQYTGLQELYKRYQKFGLEILGFPCNDFADQEPGTEVEILDFCEEKFNVKFPVFQKISILNEPVHPIYKLLMESDLPIIYPNNLKSTVFNLVIKSTFFIKGMGKPNGNGVQWNFHKFLIDREGKPAASFASQMEPEDSKLIRQIETELNRKLV